MKFKVLTIFLAFFSFSTTFCQPLKKVFLSLDDISRLALKNNFQVQLAKYDVYIKENDITETKSLFDTVLSGKLTYTDDEKKQSSTIFGTKSLTNEYELAASKKIPTGTTISASLYQKRQWTNSAFSTINPSYDIQAKLSIMQELGKNFFGLLDRGEIKITALDIENTTYTSYDKIEKALARAQKNYWALVLAKKRVEIYEEMLEKAQQLYKMQKRKHTWGLIEEPQLLASLTNVKKRENQLLLAKNSYHIALNNLLFSLNLDAEKIIIIPADDLKTPDTDCPQFYASLNEAVKLRRDYKRQKNILKRENIKLAMKKNALFPEINLELSFLRNGLSKDYRKAFSGISSEDNPEMFLGVSFSFPLENSQARAEFNKEKLEKAKSLLKLKEIERKIVVEIKNSVDTLTSFIQQEKLARQVLDLERKKLTTAERIFLQGRFDTKTIIDYQDDLLQAEINWIESVYKIKIAEIDLSLAKNSLLRKYWKILSE